MGLLENVVTSEIYRNTLPENPTPCAWGTSQIHFIDNYAERPRGT